MDLYLLTELHITGGEMSLNQKEKWTSPQPLDIQFLQANKCFLKLPFPITRANEFTPVSNLYYGIYIILTDFIRTATIIKS